MKNNIQREIVAWNNRFPLDNWWRKKYKISYLSSAHRESTFYGQYFEYHEDLLFEQWYEEDKDKDKEFGYAPMTDSWWIPKQSSEEEIDNWFNEPL